MATVAKACAGLAWCVNPCQIVYEHRETALRYITPPSGLGEPPQNVAQAKPKHGKEDRAEKTGCGLWAGRAPTRAPAWAAFSPGLRHKGRQSAVAYATKVGHLIQVQKSVVGPRGESVGWVCFFSGVNNCSAALGEKELLSCARFESTIQIK